MSYYIFGIQRSGTNYLCQLIDHNFNTTCINNFDPNIWKHSIQCPPTYKPKGDEGTIVIHKNPYTWVESLCYRKRVDWLKRQTKYPANELHANSDYNVRGMNIINLTKTWVDFHINWLTDDHMIIKYENLLDFRTRNSILDTMSHRFGWIRKSLSWVNIDEGKVKQSQSYVKGDTNYYSSMQPKYLTDTQIQAISDTIPTELMDRMGYDVL